MNQSTLYPLLHKRFKIQDVPRSCAIRYIVARSPQALRSLPPSELLTAAEAAVLVGMGEAG